MPIVWVYKKILFRFHGLTMKMSTTAGNRATQKSIQWWQKKNTRPFMYFKFILSILFHRGYEW